MNLNAKCEIGFAQLHFSFEFELKNKDGSSAYNFITQNAQPTSSVVAYSIQLVLDN